MGFGVKAGGLDGAISRTTNNTAEVAEKLDEVGAITDMHTFGAKTEIQEEAYFVGEGEFTSEAVNGQSGIAGVVTAHNLIEVNNDFAKVSKTTVKAPETT